MSYGAAGDSRQTKNERREAAREKARVLRQQQKKTERRRKIFLQGGLILGTLAVIAIIAVVVVNSARPAGPGPLNMLSDGIQVGQNFEAKTTAGLAADAEPVANPLDPDQKVIDIRIYVDYLCPFCNQFEQTNNPQLEALLDKGAATVEIHPISILDSSSQGTQYSTRAANAAACVANYSPNDFWAVNKAFFANQPAERSAGLSDEELISIVGDAGVSSSAVSDCIKGQDFKAWVKAATQRALTGPLPGTEKEVVAGTPTVLVNGLKYPGAVDNADTFAAFIVQAAGATFSTNSTPTPTPTPTPTK